MVVTFNILAILLVGLIACLALEEKLHGLGVTSYAQIADWTAEDIARVDTELNFKGRIEREDWIGQARELRDRAVRA